MYICIYAYIYIYIYNDDDCVYYFKSSLVPLIEGLCSSDSSSWAYAYIFCSALSEEKIYNQKEQLVHGLIPPPGIYVHMCTLYTYTNT